MDQQRLPQGMGRNSHGAKRRSESVSGEFWSALRLEEDVHAPPSEAHSDHSANEYVEDDGNSNGSSSIDEGSDEDDNLHQDPVDQHNQPSPFQEMQQVGPTSPWVLPILGLEGYALTPATAFRKQPGPTSGMMDYYITIKSPGFSLPPIESYSPPRQPKNARIAAPQVRQHAPAAAKQLESPVVPAGRFRPPPMLGPGPRPALPSLSSAPVVPSWRSRAASANRAPAKRSVRGYANSAPRLDLLEREDDSDSQLLDSLVDSAWSEPSTPVTPMEMGDSTPYISDDESSFSLDRSRRGDLIARRDSRRTELQSVVSDSPLSGELMSGGIDEMMKGNLMPHRKPGTPVSILKPTRYRPPKMGAPF